MRNLGIAVMERTMRRRSRMGMVNMETFICILVSLAVTQAHVALTFPPARLVPYYHCCSLSIAAPSIHSST